jgi:hypothetical protein
MSKEEYMTALKNNIQALTVDEQNEALQYYYDYFEEAGDDQKVIEELGDPEVLAKSIIERFANAVVNVKNEEKDEEKDTESQTSFAYDGLYYNFEKAKVKNIEFSFGAAEVVVIPGNSYSVETRGILKENLLCRVDTEGTFVVKNLKKLNGLNFWSHERVSRIVPRILITVPANANVEKFTTAIGAGSLEARNVNISCNRGKIDVGAGNCVLKNLFASNMNIRCGMGNIKIEGSISGDKNIDCGMGSVKLQLEGNSADYSYDAKVGLGDFKFNKDRKSGVCQSYSDMRKDNHFSVNCGMGTVNISIGGSK